MDTLPHPLRLFIASSLATALLPSVAQAQTWDGSDSKFWSTSGNWSSSTVPAPGSNITIQSSTSNNALWLDTNRSIGLFNFGSRTNAFEVQTGPIKVLTIAGGITTTANFSTSPATLVFRGNYAISANQTWQVSGSEGTTETDRGAAFRATEDEVTPATLLLSGNLTKTGTGQLSLLGASLDGGGDLIIQDGSLKVNAGAGVSAFIGGSGKLILQGDSKLLTSRNSGVFGTWTRPLSFHDTSEWIHRGGSHGNSIISSPVSWNGTEHNLSVGRFLTLGGPWSGSSTIHKRAVPGEDSTGAETLVLAGASTAFQGTLINQYGITRIQAPFQGAVSATEGVVFIDASVGGSLSSTSPTAEFVLKDQSSTALISGSLAVTSAQVSGEASVAQGVQLDSASLVVKPDTAARLSTLGNLSLGNTTRPNQIILDGTPVSGQAFTVVEYAGNLNLSDGGTLSDYLELAGGNDFYRSPSFTAVSGTPNRIDAKVSTASLNWIGAVDDAWDVWETATWSGATNGFHHMDAVTFNDSAAAFDAEMSGTLRPSLITLATSANKSSSISSTLFGGSLSGGVRIVKNGAGTVTLGGGAAQNYTGTVTVNQGLLKLGTSTALGKSPAIYITNDISGQPGGQVDLNGVFFGSTQLPGAHHFYIEGSGPDGKGALVNSPNHPGTGTVGTDAGVHSLTLTANAKISSVGRYDVGFSRLAGTGSIRGNNHTLTVETETFPVGDTPSGKIGMAFMGAGADDSPIHINVAKGVVWAQDNDRAFGGNGSTLTIAANARAGTSGPRTIAVPVTIQSGGTLHSQASSTSGTATWTGAFTLMGNANIHTGGHRIEISGNVSQSGVSTLTKLGDGELVLSGTSTYTGETTVDEGTLLVNGIHGIAGSSPITIENGGALGGTGEVRGNITVESGGILAPGDVTSSVAGTASVGTLRTRTVTIQGDYFCEIDGDDCDRIEVDGNLTLSNSPYMTFNVLPGGVTRDFYVVATYTGSYSGSISSGSSSGRPSGFSLTHNATAKRLELSRSTSGYPAWVNSFTLPGTAAEPAEDPDQDGHSNYDEFLFGTSPVSGSGSPVTTASTSPNVIVRWLQRSSGSTYVLQESTTLGAGSWTTSTVVPETDTSRTGVPSGYSAKMATIPPSNTRKFLRISAQ